MRLMILAAVAALTASTGALAAPLPAGGVSAQQVVEVLQSRGYRAELDTDGVGDPLVRSAADGVNFGIYFYGCEQGRCTSIQYIAAFDTQDMSYAKINSWNKAHRFGRVYLDDEMDPFLEMDVDLERGASTELIEESLVTWSALVPEFKRYIGF